MRLVRLHIIALQDDKDNILVKFLDNFTAQMSIIYKILFAHTEPFEYARGNIFADRLARDLSE